MAWSGLGAHSCGQAGGNAVMGISFRAPRLELGEKWVPKVGRRSLSEEERDGEQIKQMVPTDGFSSSLWR